MDTLSLIQLLVTSRFHNVFFLFMIDFQSLYTNIRVEDANLILEILKVMLKNSFMTFDGEYFQQTFGVIMGTNVTPILANCTWLGWNTILKEKCKTDPKLKWAVLFKRFIDDSYGSIDGNKLDFVCWVLNSICYEGIDLSLFGKLDLSGFYKKENKYLYILMKSGHRVNYEGILNHLRGYYFFFVKTLQVIKAFFKKIVS